MFDCGDHYAVRLSNRKEFLADKIDLQFIENHIWCSTNDYACCKQNKRKIKFHNLILGHIPNSNASVDHINQIPLDNRRINLRIATHQTQMINRGPQNMGIQPGVNFCRNHWVATWADSLGAKKCAYFNINKLGYEVAKQLAINQRNEIELSLNHYRIALHNLPPLELLKPEEPEVNYDFEEPEEPDEI